MCHFFIDELENNIIQRFTSVQENKRSLFLPLCTDLFTNIIIVKNKQDFCLIYLIIFIYRSIRSGIHQKIWKISFFVRKEICDLSCWRLIKFRLTVTSSINFKCIDIALFNTITEIYNRHIFLRRLFLRNIIHLSTFNAGYSRTVSDACLKDRKAINKI